MSEPRPVLDPPAWPREHGTKGQSQDPSQLPPCPSMAPLRDHYPGLDPELLKTGLTLQAGGSHPARGTEALPMDGVTGGPVETGTNLAAVKPISEGWASCKQRGAIRDIARGLQEKVSGS